MILQVGKQNDAGLRLTLQSIRASILSLHSIISSSILYKQCLNYHKMPRRTVSQKEHAYSGAANFTGVQDRIMEHGTLLWAFNEGPGRKKDNRLVKNDEGYKLPFDKEKQLSEDFAFLAARTDDSRYVVAVAIEEDEDDSGITIRLAMNEGNLEIIKSGFEKIANILRRAALRGKHAENSVYRN